MRILIVEDEHRIAEAIKQGLELEGMAVDVVHDGEEGYDLAGGEEYDVIVLDLMLPKMNGLEVCKSLRDEGIHTPVLILTARGEVDDKVEGLNVGADDYLTKPFAFVELLARIKALSRRPKENLGIKLSVGDLVLDTTALKVDMGGVSLELTKKEFALLEYLMRHQGRIVSKEQIINHVWNYEADVLPNTVEVNVGNLRKKLKEKDGNEIIKTVRGFGYKIEE